MIKFNMRYLLVLIAVFLIAPPATAEMYVYVDGNGSLLMTDNPHLNSSETATKLNQWTLSPIYEYEIMIKEISARYRVDPRLVMAIVSTESNFNELAVSSSGAMGLMQLMPDTAKQLGVENPFDPRENLEGGIKYVRYLLERFDGNVELAVAAYNCGPGALERNGGIPPFGETSRYVKKVFDRYHGKKQMQIKSAYRRTVRKIVRPDGSIIYTNMSSEALNRKQ